MKVRSIITSILRINIPSTVLKWTLNGEDILRKRRHSNVNLNFHLHETVGSFKYPRSAFQPPLIYTYINIIDR